MSMKNINKPLQFQKEHYEKEIKELNNEHHRQRLKVGKGIDDMLKQHEKEKKEIKEKLIKRMNLESYRIAKGSEGWGSYVKGEIDKAFSKDNQNDKKVS